MTIADLVDSDAAGALEQDAADLMAELYPVCRSITGDGLRSTLRRVDKEIALRLHEVPSGTQVLDWTVPPEWNVRDAYVADGAGRRVIDFQRSNLHLVGYSVPVRTTMSLGDLRPHLHTLPEHPDWTPYRTTYYSHDWGFCLSQRELDALADEEYEVCVDTTLEPGSLTYGECVLPGESADEVLVSTHVCHPSMANDNLSGIVGATMLARLLTGVRHRYTYRFVMVPGTIGSLTWLATHEDALARIRYGLVVTGVGGPGPLTWKRTKEGDTAVDRAAEHVMGHRGGDLRDYSPWGYDERQYNAPGFDLHVGRLTRTPHGEYPEYHTSADDLSLVSAARVMESVAAALEILDVLENDALLTRIGPRGEPQLGRRGLYPSVGGHSASRSVMAMLWCLGLADGRHRLSQIAQRSELPFATVRRTATLLAEQDLLEVGNRPPDQD